MRNSPLYILILVTLIGGVMGYSYFTSEVITVQVTGKRVEEGRSRYGMASTRFVIETQNNGRLSILKFPVIGFPFDAEYQFSRIRSGTEQTVRVGYFPPDVMGHGKRPQIMAVY